MLSYSNNKYLNSFLLLSPYPWWNEDISTYGIQIKNCPRLRNLAILTPESSNAAITNFSTDCGSSLENTIQRSELIIWIWGWQLLISLIIPIISHNLVIHFKKCFCIKFLSYYLKKKIFVRKVLLGLNETVRDNKWDTMSLLL